jgi:hypothetical protein
VQKPESAGERRKAELAEEEMDLLYPMNMRLASALVGSRCLTRTSLLSRAWFDSATEQQDLYGPVKRGIKE